MKKLIGTAFIFFSCLTLIQAQTSFGVKAGYNSSSVDRKVGEDYDSKSGLHVGGLANIGISENFAVQSEVVFSMQGGQSSTSTLKLNYINVPLLAQYKFGNGLRLHTGPQVGFNVSARQIFPPSETEVDVDEFYEPMDYSWVFGAAYQLASGLGFDARYNLGLNNINNEGNNEFKNRVIQLGLYYMFNSAVTKK